MASLPVRAALLVVALCIGAWLAQGFRALDLEAEGLAMTQRAQQDRLERSELAEVRQTLRDAGRFSADQGPLLSEGFLLAVSGRREDAYEVARRVIRKEPENVRAWFLARLTAPDRRRADQAGNRLEELNPLVDAAL